MPEELTPLKPGTYWLTRIIFLRLLGFVYFVAFACAALENEALLGSSGLLPYTARMDQIERYAGA